MTRELKVESSATVTTLDGYGNSIYFIEQGNAAVLTDGGESIQLGPGDTSRRDPLLTGQRTATVAARTPMRLLLLSDQDFQRIRARVPEFEALMPRIGLERARR